MKIQYKPENNGFPCEGQRLESFYPNIVSSEAIYPIMAAPKQFVKKPLIQLAILLLPFNKLYKQITVKYRPSYSRYIYYIH